MKQEEKAVRFEARQWRAAFTGTDSEDKPKAYPAEWAVYDSKSGIRMEYSKDKAAARTTAEKWNGGKIPEAMQDKAESAAYLKTILKPGDEVRTILRSCSRSGMSRRISLVVAREGEVQDITYHAARTMGENIKQGGQYVQDAGIVIGGCGMDMGFSLVYNLSRYLFPDGFAASTGLAPSGHNMNPGSFRGHHAKPLTKEDMAAMVAKGWKFHGRNDDPSGWDNDGGYALGQRWL
jgi:hypothetical protein